MTQFEDYAGDEWMRPRSSRETQLKIDLGRATRGASKRPRLEKSPWKSGDCLLGFELRHQIGSGSHGWVYEVREIATGKIMALKLFSAVEPKEAVRAKTGFRRMSKLRHRGLVRLYRIHHEDDLLAFSMERIDGDHLVQVFRRWRSLPLLEACENLTEMLRQVGSALAWTHAHQLVHRDIKPTNLMLTADEKRFVIIDCDLTGEFEAESDPENTRSYLIWTPMYVAPEVLFRQSYCPGSDIFSLGMVVLEALRLFSSAERRRESEAQGARDLEALDRKAGSGEQHEIVIPRDEQSQETDREHITSALGRLHADVPELLIDIVSEMLSPDISDRPTAMSLSRLGQASALPSPLAFQNHASARAQRITASSRVGELTEFRRWCHLILGGEVQRLHIEGPSGIGKSTFLELALADLRSQSWPLVFVARCQRFEQLPLQAFSQIADEIVMRFRRGGLEKLLVDSVSESILQRALPALDEVLEVDWSEQPLMTSPTRAGGLDAAMKVCNQLRRAGPLFFVIDDVQWADQDTLQTLDHLVSIAGRRVGPPLHQGLGLITVSRTQGDRLQQPASSKIKLGPLPREITAQAIQSEAQRHDLQLEAAHLDALAGQIEGLPYRLEAYLSELSPSGLLHERFSDAPSIQEVWQHRSEQLQDSVAELLKLIVIAGRQITFAELSCVRDNAAILERQLDELAENRLIVRDGLDGQYVKVWHDRLSQQLLKKISAEEQRRLHRQWATGLASVSVSDSVSVSAGRIAEHYQQAGEMSEFIPWARQAAAQAHQVYAHIEAARWYAAVAAQTTDEQRHESLRLAAEGMQRGGRLLEASKLYHELSQSMSGQAKIDAELEAVQCLIRSGRFAEAVEHLDPLLKRLALPRRKPAWRSRLSLLWNLIRQRVSSTNGQLRESQSLPERSALHASQIAACRALVHPLSMIDSGLSAELNAFNRNLVGRYGSRYEQMEQLIGAAIFASLVPGRKRRDAQESLNQLANQLTDADSPAIHGDVYSGLAWSAAMSGCWRDASGHAQQSRDFYKHSEIHHGFEIAHTNCVQAIAYFQLGDLVALAEMADDMQAEATTTNDLFVLAMGSLGYNSVVFLMRDGVESMQNIYERLQPSMHKIGEDAFAMITQSESLLRAAYLNRPAETMAVIARLEQLRRRRFVQGFGLKQLLLTELTAVCVLSLLSDARTKSVAKFRRLISLLRRTDVESAAMKADLYEGIAHARYPEVFGRTKAAATELAMARLERASTVAQDQALTPFLLAAQDELAKLRGERPTKQLDAFLRSQGVVNVAAFARLYRGAE